MSTAQWVGNSSFQIKYNKKALAVLNEAFSKEGMHFKSIEEIFKLCGFILQKKQDNTYEIKDIGDSIYQEDLLFKSLGSFVKKSGSIQIYMEDGEGPGEFLTTYNFTGSKCLDEMTYCFKNPKTGKIVCINIDYYDEGMTEHELIKAHKQTEQTSTIELILKKFDNANEIPLYYVEDICNIPKHLQSKPIHCVLLIDIPSHKGTIYTYWCNKSLKILERYGYMCIDDIFDYFEKIHSINRDDWLAVNANK